MRLSPLAAQIIGFALMLPALAAAQSVTTLELNGDGKSLNTAAIQSAIDAYSAQGGGTLVVPAGRYLTGTIQLKDNITLRLDEGATLLGSPDAADYRNVDPFLDGLGAELGYALVVAKDAKNVGIEGPGTIDGQGKAVKASQKKYTIRPFLVRWVRCSNVSVKDVHLRYSGAWTMNLVQSHDVAIERVSILSLGLGNNDGIDIDSCRDVRIRDCDIESGDDAICLKATSAEPCRDITVSGCRLKTFCNAIKLGTESLGDFENINVSQCEVRDTGMAGIAIYSMDGAQIRDVNISDIKMNGVAAPISIRLGARLKTFRPGDKPKTPGTIRDVAISNVTATGVRQIGIIINGVPNHPVEALTFSNINIEVPGGGKAEDANVTFPEKETAYPEVSMFGKIMPAYGMYMRHARDIRFENVKVSVVKPDPRPAAVLIDVEKMTPSDFSPKAP